MKGRFRGGFGRMVQSQSSKSKSKKNRKPGKEYHPNWGGYREPKRPGAKVGHPGEPGGEDVSIRLDPWLIMKLGLKTERAKERGYDAAILRKYMDLGYKALSDTGAEDYEFYKHLDATKPAYGSSAGRGRNFAVFTPWLTAADLRNYQPLLRGGETMRQFVPRLITVGAATEGTIKPSPRSLSELAEEAGAFLREMPPKYTSTEVVLGVD